MRALSTGKPVNVMKGDEKESVIKMEKEEKGELEKRKRDVEKNS